MRKLFDIRILFALVIDMSFIACDAPYVETDFGIDISGTINGYDYVDLGLPSGILWATCNVGASNPEDYGNHYAWGETRTKYSYDWNSSGYYKWGVYDSKDPNDGMTKYNQTDGKTTLDASDDVARTYWGVEWRMPTYEEQRELCTQCTWVWGSLNGTNGYKIKGPNGNILFLPAAGMYIESEFYSGEEDGYYWSSTRCFSSPCEAYAISFDMEHYYFEMEDFWRLGRFAGCSVRPVCASLR